MPYRSKRSSAKSTHPMQLRSHKGIKKGGKKGGKKKGGGGPQAVARKVANQARKSKDPTRMLRAGTRKNINSDQFAEAVAVGKLGKADNPPTLGIDADGSKNLRAWILQYVGGGVKGNSLPNGMRIPVSKMPRDMELDIEIRQPNTTHPPVNVIDWTVEQAQTMCAKVVECLAKSKYGEFRKMLYKDLKTLFLLDELRHITSVSSSKYGLSPKIEDAPDEEIASNAMGKLNVQVNELLHELAYHTSQLKDIRANNMGTLLTKQYRYCDTYGGTNTCCIKWQGDKFDFVRSLVPLYDHKDFQAHLKSIFKWDIKDERASETVFKESLKCAVKRQGIAVHWCEIQHITMRLMRIWHYAIHGNEHLDWIIRQYRTCMLNAMIPEVRVWELEMGNSMREIIEFYDSVASDIEKKQSIKLVSESTRVFTGANTQVDITRVLSDKQYQVASAQQHWISYIKNEFTTLTVKQMLQPKSESAKKIPRTKETALLNKNTNYHRLVDKIYYGLVLESCWTNKENTWRELFNGYKHLKSREVLVDNKLTGNNNNMNAYITLMIQGGFLNLACKVDGTVVKYSVDGSTVDLTNYNTLQKIQHDSTARKHLFTTAATIESSKTLLARELFQRELHTLYKPLRVNPYAEDDGQDARRGGAPPGAASGAPPGAASGAPPGAASGAPGQATGDDSTMTDTIVHSSRPGGLRQNPQQTQLFVPG